MIEENMNAESEAKKLKEKLFKKSENLGKIMCLDELEKAREFSTGYKDFLNKCKTEREAAQYVTELCKSNGFKLFSDGEIYKAGDRIYFSNRGKSIIAAIIGKKPLSEGVGIIASHIDSPRLDLKQNPLYEDRDLAYFKTHYYGGIKKYQWTAVPLSLHGVVVKKNGTIVEVNIGECEEDPVFVITDLLPHLAASQYKRPSNELIRGEELNILIGSNTFRDDKESELVKLNILNILNEKYGITEADFSSAELEAVPALKACDVGFDRSLIGAYGQDDRVCAYTSLMAVLDTNEIPDYTIITVLADKEEVGSDGNTGLNSSFLRYFIEGIAETQDVPLRILLSNSKCLSADVSSGFDPTFPDVLEKMNASYLNHGVALMKYTGSRGKAGTNDASAEYVGEVRRIFEENNIVWQTGELGKVDLGGGGTVAMYISKLNVDTVDVGVPVLSMHSPYEITSKNDIYMTYKAFLAFIGR